MSLTIDELKEKILQEYDVDLLCEVLEITAEDILNNFEFRLIDNIEIFEELYDHEET